MLKNKNKFLQKFLSDYLFIFGIVSVVFILRVPFLFDPLTNSSTSIILSAANNLLDFNSFTLLEKVYLYLTKFAFFLLGPSIWSIKFFLNLWVIIFLVAIWYFGRNILKSKNFSLFIIFLSFVFTLEPFKTNEINFFSLLFLPLLLVIIILLPKLTFQESSKFALLIVVIFIFSIFNLSNNRSNFNYYPNFISYLTARLKDKPLAEEKYLGSFGADVKTSYSLASLVKSKTSKQDQIFVIDNKPSIYFLSNRKAASRNFTLAKILEESNSTITDLSKNLPKVVLVDKAINKPLLDSYLTSRYNFSAQTENVKIYLLKKS